MNHDTTAQGKITIARVVGLLSAAMGAGVLSGWAMGIPRIKSVLEGAVDMKANTAVGLLLAGTALCLLDSRRPGICSRIGQVIALLVALLGLATLGQFVFGWSLGIDELLFRDTSEIFNPHPGRMSPYSALAFAATGLGLVALPARAWRSLALLASSLTVLIGSYSLIGYLWDASEVVSDSFVSPVAVHTAVAFLMLGTGTLTACRAMDGRAIRKFSELSPVEKRSLAGFVATLVILLIAGGFTYRATVANSESAAMVVQTQNVRVRLGSLYAAASDAESQQRSYFLSGNASHLEEFRDHAAAAEREAEILTLLVAGSPDQSQRMAELRIALDERIHRLHLLAVTFEESGLSEVQEIVRGGEGNKLMAELRSLVSEMDSTEAELLTTREMDAARDRAKTLVFLLATLAVAVAGFLILFRGIRREMTSRARAEEELRRSEESLEVTLHSIGDAVLATNTEGCITRMNPVAEKLTGWKQAEARGRPIAEVFRIINEETRQTAVIPVEKVLETGEVQGLANHTVLIARDGTERPIADSAAPIRARDGKILGVVLVCRDVSSERDAAVALEYERYLLNALMDNMTADIYFKDRESRILRSNRSHARRLGLDDPAKAVGRTDFDFFSAEHAEQAAEDERRVIQTGEPVSKEEKETWPDGRVSWAFSVKVPLLDKQGKTAGTFGISHDISARKKTEEQIARLNADLQRKAAELEVANKELEAFSYSVSHDLRAPLRHVLGYVEMLTRETQDQLSEKSRRFLKTISDAGSDMGKLIDDLLSFSRMGRAELREEVVDLNVLFDEVCGELAESTVGRDIRWTVARLPEVHGDRAMLKQVLANLLGNSIKYTRSRTPAEIDVGFTKDGDGQLAFHVRDNGAGFDMKYADKLFGVFQRLHRPDEFEGTGIGLANVRRVVARHGGRTWAEGKPDHGATFYFTLRPA